jgi:hypothetical protein
VSTIRQSLRITVLLPVRAKVRPAVGTRPAHRSVLPKTARRPDVRNEQGSAPILPLPTLRAHRMSRMELSNPITSADGGPERTLRRSYGHGSDELDRSLPVSLQARCSFEGDPPSGSANQRSSGEQPDATAATERKTRQALSVPWEDRAHSCWWPRCVAHTQCTLVAFRELLHAHPCADPWTFRAASSTAARMRR